MKYIINYTTIFLILSSCASVEVARKTGKVIKSIDASIKEDRVIQDEEVNQAIQDEGVKIENQKKYVEISLIGKSKEQLISKFGKPNLVRKNMSTYSMRFDKKNCLTYVFFNPNKENTVVEYFEIRNKKGKLILNKKDINNCF